jgi:hypothetical protein
LVASFGGSAWDPSPQPSTPHVPTGAFGFHKISEILEVCRELQQIEFTKNQKIYSKISASCSENFRKIKTNTKIVSDIYIKFSENYSNTSEKMEIY